MLRQVETDAAPRGRRAAQGRRGAVSGRMTFAGVGPENWRLYSQATFARINVLAKDSRFKKFVHSLPMPGKTMPTWPVPLMHIGTRLHPCLITQKGTGSPASCSPVDSRAIR